MLSPLTTLGVEQEEAPLLFPVPLNHFFVVVDSETYAAIESSPFLRTEFAPFEQRTTARSDRTYSGLYFYGTHTYFEFFDVAAEPGRRLGDSGIAFGVDEPGAVPILQTRLAAHFPVQQGVITRQLGERQIPWFLSLGLAELPRGAAVNPWIMEYDPHFLAEWHPEADDSQGISREQILRRYAAVLPDAPARPYLQDVTGLTLAVEPPAASLLTSLCRLLGYHARSEGEATLLDGPDLLLRLVPESSSERGIRQVALRVRRVTEGPAALHFGPRSVLAFQGAGTAVWSF